MLDIFSGLRLVVKRRSINIDNAIFRCHWFFTSTLLISCSLIITARQYVGQPIECHSVNKLPDSLLNSYCWVQSTFSVPQACNQQHRVGIDIPYPCIDNTRGREIKMYAYYQWVGMVLFIQGLLFHSPYYLWKHWENGLIKAITGGLRVAVLNEEERAKKKRIVVEYIYDHLGCHNRYAYKYFLCEFICLVNLMGQLWATNKFFDDQFLRYGIDVLHYSSSSISSQFISTSVPVQEKPQQSLSSSNQNQVNFSQLRSTSASEALLDLVQHHPKPANQLIDPMTYIFPRMTKCTYYDFGSSGDVQKHDALCLLPLNIINEKIYIALWFWFLILALLTLLVILYRLLAIVSESVRCKGLVSRCKLSNELDVQIICRHCQVGDWFLFYMVAENLDPLIMREIVAEIGHKIRGDLELKRDPNLPSPDESMYDDGDSGCEKDMLSTGKSRLMFDENNNPLSDARNGSYHNVLFASSRRSSVVDQVPLVKKIRKRLYNKRLWSIDLGSGDLRQQLFGTSSMSNNTPTTNDELHPLQSISSPLESQAGASRNRFLHRQSPNISTQAGRAFNVSDEISTNITTITASAPPANELPLGSASAGNTVIQHRTPALGTRISSTKPLRPRPTSIGAKYKRRGSLTRSLSGVSSADSYVIEMSTISGSTSALNEVREFESDPTARWRLAHQHSNVSGPSHWREQ